MKPNSVPAASVAGIPRGNLYMLSQPFLDLLHASGLGLQGLRLAHLLAHAICREVPDWHGLTVRQPDTGHVRQCLALRQRLGLERSRGNRAFARGIAELSRTGLYEWIDFVEDNHALAWRMRDDLFEIFFEGSPYGYFDIDALRQIDTPLDLMIHGDIGIIRGMNQPQVCLSLRGYGEALGRSQEWHRLRPDMVRALQRSAALHDCGLVVLLECRGTGRRIDAVSIRARTARSRWTWPALTKPPPQVPVRKLLLIDAQRCVETSPRAALADAEAFFSGKRPVRSQG